MCVEFGGGGEKARKNDENCLMMNAHFWILLFLAVYVAVQCSVHTCSMPYRKRELNSTGL